MQQSTARILNDNRKALAVTASAARISTQEGTALDIYARSGDDEKDLKLIRKVLSSGHQSVIEHQTVSVAFNDVSVLVEQYIIEFRLASFTVKSRRYVDFSEAGYVVPEGMTDEQKKIYEDCMNARFRDYARLLELGVPKEDARFLFPYSLRSNFFVTMNARELMRMVRSMLYGRGARFSELRRLGEQLKAQFDALYPQVISEADVGETTQDWALPKVFCARGDVAGRAELLSSPSNAESLLEMAMDFSGRWGESGKALTAENVRRLLSDARPRELEVLNYTFRIFDVSLACVTHFTRHRIQSPMIPDVLNGLCAGKFVLPQSVHENAEAERIYRAAFDAQAQAATALKALGAPAELLSYLSMSGHVVDLLMTMNARELLLFARLRTCTRAQWEIRAVARQMVQQLNQTAPTIFGGYGPSCAITGKCPEGKMSCGRPVRIENGVWTTRK